MILFLLTALPGFSALSENIFNAADIVLMPVIPTTLSIRTYNMVKDYFKEKDLDISKMMCFFTMTDLRKNMHNEIMEELYKDKRFFQNYIPYLSDVEKMGIHKAPIMEFANSSYAANCYRELWTEIKEGVLNNEIDLKIDIEYLLISFANMHSTILSRPAYYEKRT